MTEQENEEQEKVVTIIRDDLFAAAQPNHTKYHTIIATTKKELLFDREVEVVKKIICLENQEEYPVPLMLAAKDVKSYIQFLIGNRHGTFPLNKTKQLD